MITGLERLYEAMREADSVVAHNIEFDSRMLFIELMRHKEYGNMIDGRIFDMIRIIEKKNYCTMKNGIEICKIIAKSREGKEYYKWPKLIELYKKLFNSEVENLHNSLIEKQINNT